LIARAQVGKAVARSKKAPRSHPLRNLLSVRGRRRSEPRARFRATWLPLASGTDGSVWALLVYNGELIVGGGFGTAGGVPASGVARWNGSVWQPLGTGTNGLVQALTVYNGDLIAGGGFSVAGGMPANWTARWKGSTWQALGTGPGAYVSALTVFGGEVIAGTQITGNALSGIARWNGSTWQALDNGIGGLVLALAAYDGGLVAGGGFLSASAVISPFLARWGAPLPRIMLSQPGGTGTEVLVADSFLTSGHEYYKVVSFELCAGGPESGRTRGSVSTTSRVFLATPVAARGAALPFHRTRDHGLVRTLSGPRRRLDGRNLRRPDRRNPGMHLSGLPLHRAIGACRTPVWRRTDSWAPPQNADPTRSPRGRLVLWVTPLHGAS
jgi:hypothetical protein